MNHHIDPVKTGISVGKLLGGLHLLWAILVAAGWAQALVNFSMWAHMVSVPIVVKPFDFSAAVTVVVVASVVGYVLGYLFARSLNWLHHR